MGMITVMAHAKDASCRVTADYVALLRARGAPVGELVDGLEVSLDQIEDRSNWLDWEAFLEIVSRVETMIGGPDGWRAFSRDLGEKPETWRLRRILPIAVSPQQLYRIWLHWLTPALFAMERPELELLGGGRMRLTFCIPGHLAGGAPFLRTGPGIATILPTLLGLPEAEVQSTIGSHHAELIVTLRESKKAPTRWRRFVALLRDSGQVVDELTRQQSALQQSYDELQKSYEDLRARERELKEQIQQREQAEQALRERETQLRQAQKMEAIGQLAGGIAHDFNNIMMAILGYADLLQQQVSSDEAAVADVFEIRRAAERASTLTAQLLAFSRRQVLRPVKLDINRIVRSSQRMLERLVVAEVELALDLAPNLATVEADAGQLEQVIVNLVLNARDAMANGGCITLQTSNVIPSSESEDCPTVRLTVTDTGEGMTSYVRQRLFEPFFTTKGDRGTGLGLAMVYGIVKQSGGNIHVESTPGEGSEFRIELPAVDAEPAIESSAPPRSARRLPVGGHETILLVEDEPMLRRLLTVCLEQAGYCVLSAGSAAEALRLVEPLREPPHLVISDVVLGAERGTELVQRLSILRPGVKVLLMSGYVSAADGELPAEVPFLAKPFETVELLDRVRVVLDGEASPGVMPPASEASR